MNGLLIEFQVRRLSEEQKVGLVLALLTSALGSRSNSWVEIEPTWMIKSVVEDAQVFLTQLENEGERSEDRLKIELSKVDVEMLSRCALLLQSVSVIDDEGNWFVLVADSATTVSYISRNETDLHSLLLVISRSIGFEALTVEIVAIE